MRNNGQSTPQQAEHHQPVMVDPAILGEASTKKKFRSGTKLVGKGVKLNPSMPMNKN